MRTGGLTVKLTDVFFLLEEWKTEYGLERYAICFEYADLDGTLMGLHTPKRMLDGERFSLIQIDSVFKNSEFCCKCVLWHEFCHAEKWLKDGKTDGHGSEWNGRLWRKPLLYIGDGLIVPFVYPFLK